MALTNFRTRPVDSTGYLFLSVDKVGQGELLNSGDVRACMVLQVLWSSTSAGPCFVGPPPSENYENSIERIIVKTPRSTGNSVAGGVRTKQYMSRSPEAFI